MAMFYKATRPDGFDFRTRTVDYAGALDSGEVVRHPSRPGWMIAGEPSTYLSVSVEPAETLIGGRWPCRLFRVEPEGDVLDGLAVSPHKRACLALRVVEELPAWQALGPNGGAVAALIQQAAEVTPQQMRALAAVVGAARCAPHTAARDAARGAARGAALAAVWGAAWDVARGVARDAAAALVVRDLITAEQYATLAGPWESLIPPL